MSHSVTIRTHTVTTNTSVVVINTGYFKTWGGILKLLQFALGIVCVGLVGYQFSNYGYNRSAAELMFLIIATTFLTGTFVLLLSNLASLSTASILPKTLHELLYHMLACGLILAVSCILVSYVTDRHRYREYEELLAASICGLLNAVLYLFSSILALRSYRGL